MKKHSAAQVLAVTFLAALPIPSLFAQATLPAQATPLGPAPAATPSPSHSTQSTLPSPVPYTVVRYNEEYSYLKDPAKRADYLDPIKYIPLGAEDFYLSLGGQIRERYEYFNNNTFGVGPQDEDGYFLTRILLHGDLHLSRYFRVFAQGKSALEDDREGGYRPSDRDEIDVQHLFTDFRIPWQEGLVTTFRFGRQELQYGAQRVIGPGDWTNTRRTFDGFKVINEYKSSDYTNTLDAFLVRPVLIRKNPLANEVEGFNEGDDSQTFWGVYDTVGLPGVWKGASLKVEPYFLVLNQQASVSNVTPARVFDADIYTVGMRVSANPTPFDFDVEGAYQFGTKGPADISAFSVSTETGVTLAGWAFRPRVFVGFDYASGDGRPGDATNTIYTQLFPTSHRFFGEIDVIGRQNIVSPNVGVDAALLQNESFVKRLGVRTQFLSFFKANDHDAQYLAAGTPLTRPAASSASFLGSEVDFIMTWQVDRHLLVSASYCHYFAGDYINESSGGKTEAAQDIDFAYLVAQYTF